MSWTSIATQRDTIDPSVVEAKAFEEARLREAKSAEDDPDLDFSLKGPYLTALQHLENSIQQVSDVKKKIDKLPPVWDDSRVKPLRQGSNPIKKEKEQTINMSSEEEEPGQQDCPIGSKVIAKVPTFSGENGDFWFAATVRNITTSGDTFNIDYEAGWSHSSVSFNLVRLCPNRERNWGLAKHVKGKNVVPRGCGIRSQCARKKILCDKVAWSNMLDNPPRGTSPKQVKYCKMLLHDRWDYTDTRTPDLSRWGGPRQPEYWNKAVHFDGEASVHYGESNLALHLGDQKLEGYYQRKRSCDCMSQVPPRQASEDFHCYWDNDSKNELYEEWKACPRIVTDETKFDVVVPAVHNYTDIIGNLPDFWPGQEALQLARAALPSNPESVLKQRGALKDSIVQTIRTYTIVDYNADREFLALEKRKEEASKREGIGQKTKKGFGPGGVGGVKCIPGSLVVAKWPLYSGELDNPWLAGTIVTTTVDGMYIVKFEDQSGMGQKNGNDQVKVQYKYVRSCESRSNNWGTTTETRGKDVVPQGCGPAKQCLYPSMYRGITTEKELREDISKKSNQLDLAIWTEKDTKERLAYAKEKWIKSFPNSDLPRSRESIIIRLENQLSEANETRKQAQATYDAALQSARVHRRLHDLRPHSSGRESLCRAINNVCEKKENPSPSTCGQHCTFLKEIEEVKGVKARCFPVKEECNKVKDPTYKTCGHTRLNDHCRFIQKGSCTSLDINQLASCDQVEPTSEVTDEICKRQGLHCQAEKRDGKVHCVQVTKANCESIKDPDFENTHCEFSEDGRVCDDSQYTCDASKLCRFEPYIASATCSALPQTCEKIGAEGATAKNCLRRNHCEFIPEIVASPRIPAQCRNPDDMCKTVENPTSENCLIENHCIFIPKCSDPPLCEPIKQMCSAVINPTKETCSLDQHCTFVPAKKGGSETVLLCVPACDEKCEARCRGVEKFAGNQTVMKDKCHQIPHCKFIPNNTEDPTSKARCIPVPQSCLNTPAVADKCSEDKHCILEKVEYRRENTPAECIPVEQTCANMTRENCTEANHCNYVPSCKEVDQKVAEEEEQILQNSNKGGVNQNDNSVKARFVASKSLVLSDSLHTDQEKDGQTMFVCTDRSVLTEKKCVSECSDFSSRDENTCFSSCSDRLYQDKKSCEAARPVWEYHSWQIREWDEDLKKCINRGEPIVWSGSVASKGISEPYNEETSSFLELASGSNDESVFDQSFINPLPMESDDKDVCENCTLDVSVDTIGEHKVPKSLSFTFQADGIVGKHFTFSLFSTRILPWRNSAAAKKAKIIVSSHGSIINSDSVTSAARSSASRQSIIIEMIASDEIDLGNDIEIVLLSDELFSENPPARKGEVTFGLEITTHNPATRTLIKEKPESGFTPEGVVALTEEELKEKFSGKNTFLVAKVGENCATACKEKDLVCDEDALQKMNDKSFLDFWEKYDSNRTSPARCDTLLSEPNVVTPSIVKMEEGVYVCSFYQGDNNSATCGTVANGSDNDANSNSLTFVELSNRRTKGERMNLCACASKPICKRGKKVVAKIVIDDDDEESNSWYSGTITGQNADGSYGVSFEKGVAHSRVLANDIRLCADRPDNFEGIHPPTGCADLSQQCSDERRVLSDEEKVRRKFCVTGSRVIAKDPASLHQSSDPWIAGVVSNVNKDNSAAIQFNDGTTAKHVDLKDIRLCPQRPNEWGSQGGWLPSCTPASQKCKEVGSFQCLPIDGKCSENKNPTKETCNEMNHCQIKDGLCIPISHPCGDGRVEKHMKPEDCLGKSPSVEHCRFVKGEATADTCLEVDHCNFRKQETSKCVAIEQNCSELSIEHCSEKNHCALTPAKDGNPAICKPLPTLCNLIVGEVTRDVCLGQTEIEHCRYIESQSSKCEPVNQDDCTSFTPETMHKCKENRHCTFLPGGNNLFPKGCGEEMQCLRIKMNHQHELQLQKLKNECVSFCNHKDRATKTQCLYTKNSGICSDPLYNLSKDTCEMGGPVWTDRLWISRKWVLRNPETDRARRINEARSAQDKKDKSVDLLWPPPLSALAKSLQVFKVNIQELNDIREREEAMYAQWCTDEMEKFAKRQQEAVNEIRAIEEGLSNYLPTHPERDAFTEEEEEMISKLSNLAKHFDNVTSRNHKADKAALQSTLKFFNVAEAKTNVARRRSEYVPRVISRHLENDNDTGPEYPPQSIVLDAERVSKKLTNRKSLPEIALLEMNVVERKANNQQLSQLSAKNNLRRRRVKNEGNEKSTSNPLDLSEEAMEKMNKHFGKSVHNPSKSKKVIEKLTKAEKGKNSKSKNHQKQMPTYEKDSIKFPSDLEQIKNIPDKGLGADDTQNFFSNIYTILNEVRDQMEHHSEGVDGTKDNGEADIEEERVSLHNPKSWKELIATKSLSSGFVSALKKAAEDHHSRTSVRMRNLLTIGALLSKERAVMKAVCDANGQSMDHRKRRMDPAMQILIELLLLLEHGKPEEVRAALPLMTIEIENASANAAVHLAVCYVTTNFGESIHSLADEFDVDENDFQNINRDIQFGTEGDYPQPGSRVMVPTSLLRPGSLLTEGDNMLKRSSIWKRCEWSPVALLAPDELQLIEKLSTDRLKKDEEKRKTTRIYDSREPLLSKEYVRDILSFSTGATGGTFGGTGGAAPEDFLILGPSDDFAPEVEDKRGDLWLSDQTTDTSVVKLLEETMHCGAVGNFLVEDICWTTANTCSIFLRGPAGEHISCNEYCSKQQLQCDGGWDTSKLEGGCDVENKVPKSCNFRKRDLICKCSSRDSKSLRFKSLSDPTDRSPFSAHSANLEWEKAMPLKAGSNEAKRVGPEGIFAMQNVQRAMGIEAASAAMEGRRMKPPGRKGDVQTEESLSPLDPFKDSLCGGANEPCPDVNCSGHGSHRRSRNGQPASCICDPGYVGDSCESCADTHVKMDAPMGTKALPKPPNQPTNLFHCLRCKPYFTASIHENHVDFISTSNGKLAEKIVVPASGWIAGADLYLKSHNNKAVRPVLDLYLGNPEVDDGRIKSLPGQGPLRESSRRLALAESSVSSEGWYHFTLEEKTRINVGIEAVLVLSGSGIEWAVSPGSFQSGTAFQFIDGKYSVYKMKKTELSASAIESSPIALFEMEANQSMDSDEEEDDEEKEDVIPPSFLRIDIDKQKVDSQPNALRVQLGFKNSLSGFGDDAFVLNLSASDAIFEYNPVDNGSGPEILFEKYPAIEVAASMIKRSEEARQIRDESDASNEIKVHESKIISPSKLRIVFSAPDAKSKEESLKIEASDGPSMSFFVVGKLGKNSSIPKTVSFMLEGQGNVDGHIRMKEMTSGSGYVIAEEGTKPEKWALPFSRNDDSSDLSDLPKLKPEPSFGYRFLLCSGDQSEWPRLSRAKREVEEEKLRKK
eukprot:g1770.t1